MAPSADALRVNALLRRSGSPYEVAAALGVTVEDVVAILKNPSKSLPGSGGVNIDATLFSTRNDIVVDEPVTPFQPGRPNLVVVTVDVGVKYGDSAQCILYVVGPDDDPELAGLDVQCDVSNVSAQNSGAVNADVSWSMPVKLVGVVPPLWTYLVEVEAPAGWPSSGMWSRETPLA